MAARSCLPQYVSNEQGVRLTLFTGSVLYFLISHLNEHRSHILYIKQSDFQTVLVLIYMLYCRLCVVSAVHSAGDLTVKIISKWVTSMFLEVIIFKRNV